MFELVELGYKIDKEIFKKEVLKLCVVLFDVQYDMLEKKEFLVVILISGVDGSGKGEIINLFYLWMDLCYILILVFFELIDEEVLCLIMWCYW